MNEIAIKTRASSFDIKTGNEDASERPAENGGRHIKVAVESKHVTLTRDVHSFDDIKDAKLAARSAHGVTTVKDSSRISL